MPCWTRALTPIPCIMSSLSYRNIQPNINDSNPLHDPSYSYPYDPSSRSLSQTLTANSFISTPLPKTNLTMFFDYYVETPMASPSDLAEATSVIIAKKSIDFKPTLHASMNIISTLTIMQSKTSCKKLHNAPSTIRN